MLVRVGVQTRTIMNTGVVILQEAENLSTPRSRYTTLGICQRTLQPTTEILAQTCSLLLYLEDPETENNLLTCLSVDEWTKKV